MSDGDICSDDERYGGFGGNEAMLPARGIAHAHPPTAAAGLEDVRHHGWARM
jgi:hypothetical protein